MSKTVRRCVGVGYTAAVIGVGVFLTVRNGVGGLVVPLLSLAFLAAFPLLRRLLSLPQGYAMETLWLLFFFGSYTLGTGCALYARFACYDLVLHGVSGVLTTLTGLCLYTRLRPHALRGAPPERGMATAVAFLFAQTAAALWELAEYMGWVLTGHDSQNVLKTGVSDTMEDMLISLVVSAVVCLLYAARREGKKGLFFPVDEWNEAVKLQEEARNASN